MSSRMSDDATYKPAGYTSLAPYLVIDDARRTIAFLVEVFGAERLRMVDAGDGRLVHGEVRIDDTVLMMADGPPGRPANSVYVHIYVPNVDAVYRRALAAGATPVQEPVKKDDADKRGAFRDAGGTTWWVATQVG